MISSRATKFQPHPAIFVRIYAIEFGARGLSVLPFQRKDFAARREWYTKSSVNLNNFTPSVHLPKAERPRSIADVSSALTVLHVFTEKFFDQSTRRLVGAAREFDENLCSFCQSAAQDVESLVFWFDRVFEDYRTAAVSDARTGASSRTEVKLTLSFRDPELQSVVYVIQSERVLSLTLSQRPRPANDTLHLANGNRRHEPARAARKTPSDVIEALPKKDGLSVCMKYLSRRGCSSRSDEHCAFPNHVHFIPASLDPVVRNHIQHNMGDLRRELTQ
ncbi:hypothetical protein PPTG_19112 [Phytophthora nicotianae INRA-310]|uniref:Uncharacterized protein n=1 Tax=Phytophthora nicotianae (strain INRA-310) TaxID=761204 RepID=W2PDC5_PHYN3|nr:hypothetical protein PPTG_19112 [Phytophthora nicotianae INRA-310]ETM99052.1 hypothetical protein PPTG_19112 [Phytophthora nicotianae INRA-310]